MPSIDPDVLDALGTILAEGDDPRTSVVGKLQAMSKTQRDDLQETLTGLLDKIKRTNPNAALVHSMAVAQGKILNNNPAPPRGH